jgi:hypothetical protein
MALSLKPQTFRQFPTLLIRVTRDDYHLVGFQVIKEKPD